MPVIDAQLHVFERNRPERPWTGDGSPLAEATGQSTVDLLDAAGVDAAIIVSPWLNYRADPSYAVEVAAKFAGRFAVVAPVDPADSDPAAFVAAWAEVPWAVGLRLMLWSPQERTRVADGGYDALFTALEERRMPLCLALGSGTAEAQLIAERHPGIPVIIDHLGMRGAPTPPAPADPFAELPSILSLASLPNVAVKATGVPALSHEPFPYRDVFAPLRRVLDSFGPERTLWGTDWTRTHAFLGYSEGVDYLAELGLSPFESSMLRGGAASATFGLDRVLALARAAG
ncbi:hypothetical protein GCM10022381_30770 [Leifsonia kafniensis]|uniref:Amidohydrolase-related domain-containing protein n=1 Tax=Leifsonia kafniensis TaxID=475957 RepID=A0ABP7KVB1_9MICO